MNLLLPLIVLLGIPVGLFVAWLASDELRAGRKWFIALSLTSLIAGIVFFLFEEVVGATTCFFILALALAAWRKSFDKRWIKRNI